MLLIVFAGVAWRLANPPFRITLRNNSEGPITGILILDDNRVHRTPGPPIRDPGGPRTFDRLDLGASRSVTLRRRTGGTVYLFYTDADGQPRCYDIGHSVYGQAYDGVDYEIRAERSTFARYQRNPRFTDFLHGWFWMIRNVLPR